MAKIWTLSALAAATLTLAACGGGGGGSDSTDTTGGNTTPTTPTTPTYAGWQREVPTPSYAAGSPQKIAFDYLNKQLSHCGFGMMKQNSALDVAATGHAKWFGTNRIYSHNQTVGSNNFTGITPEDRMVAAGYAAAGTFYPGEVLSYQDASMNAANTAKPTFYAWGVRGLLNAPYHAAGLLKGGRDVGMFIGSARELAGTMSPGAIGALGTFINYAYKNADGSQNLNISSNEVLTFPCDGSVDIDYFLGSESPNPVPGRNLGANPIGTSIQVVVRPGQTVKITSATMIEAGTGASVVLRTPIDSTNDPNGRYQSNQAYVAADQPLKMGTKYQVTLNGTNNGTAFSRTFAFTTAECANTLNYTC